MANNIIQNNLVIPILDKVSDELDNDPSAEPLDDVILEMKKDPSKIRQAIAAFGQSRAAK